MTPKERYNMLMETGEFDFIKYMPKEQLWKLAFFTTYVYGLADKEREGGCGMTNQEQYELICEKATKYDRLVDVLDKIRAEIKDNILDEPVEYTTNSEMCAYNGGLLKALNIIDKYRKEQE